MAGVYGNMMVVPGNARGGALPTYQSSGQRYAPGAQASARLNDSAAQITMQGVRQHAESVRTLRWGIDRVAEALARVPEYEDRRAQSLARQAFAEYQNQLVEQKSQLSTLRGGDAIGANGAPDIVKQSQDWHARKQDEISSRLGSGLGSEKARKYFAELAQEAGTNFTAWAFGRREQELDRYEKSVFEAALSAETNAVASDPDDIQAAVRSMGRVQALIERQAAREGWAPEATRERVRIAFDGMIVAGVNTKLASGDIGGAAQLMSVWKSRLGAQSGAQLQKSLDDAVYRQYNAAIANGDYQQAIGLQDMALGESRRGGADVEKAFANLGMEGAVAKVNTGAMMPETKQAIIGEAKARGVPAELALAVAMTESDGNHGIADSHAGAQGLFQLMPGTAKDLGVDARDLGQNISGGISYLKKMLDKYEGNTELALMAYNWGPGNVDTWLKSGRTRTVPSETRAYPQIVANFMEGYDRKGKSRPGGNGIVQDPAIRQTIGGKEGTLLALQHIGQTDGLSLEERTAELRARAEQVPAGAQRSAYLALVNSALTQQKDLETATAGKTAHDFIDLGRGQKWSDAQWEQNIAQLEANGVSRQTLKLIRNELKEGRKESTSTAAKEARKQLLSEYFQKIDAQFARTGQVVEDTSTLDKLYAEGRITLEDYNKAVDYQKKGGSLQNVNQTKLNKLYKSLTGGKKDVCPDEIAEQVWSHFGESVGESKGRIISDDEIMQYMARQMTEVVVPGRLWGESTVQRWEAEADERVILRSRVPENLVASVKNFMLQRGATKEQAENPEYQEKAYNKMLKGEF